MTTEAEIGVMWPQAKERLKPPEAGKSKEWMDPPPEPPREHGPILVSDVQPPEPEEKAAQREKALDAGGFKEFSVVREER